MKANGHNGSGQKERTRVTILQSTAYIQTEFRSPERSRSQTRKQKSQGTVQATSRGTGDVAVSFVSSTLEMTCSSLNLSAEKYAVGML